MAKTLRVLSDPDFSTKNNTLTFEELDQNQIDIWNEAKAALDESDGDARYFRQSQAFDELATADIDTALTNLGLKDGSRDLQLASLSGSTADFSGALSANTLRTDTGKFLSPTSYQFRNAGDTGFRDVEIADLTAEDAIFNGSNTSNYVEIADSSNGTYIRGQDGTDSQEWVIRGYNISGIQAEFNLGGINVMGRGDFSGALNVDGLASFNSPDFAGLMRDRVGTADNITIGYGNDNDTAYFGYKQGDDYFSGVDNATGLETGNFRLYLDGRGVFDDTLELGGSVAWTTPTFNTGFLGSGARLYQDSSEYHLETDIGFFRSALFANEFIINQILATQGSRIASAGRGKIEEVIDSTSGAEVVDVSDPEGSSYASFTDDDIILCLQTRNDLDTDTTNVLTDSGGVITKRYVRKVSNVNGNEVTFTTASGAPSDAGTIAQGDVIVAVANTTDTNRQNLLYETVIEPHSPYTALKTGLDSWDAFKSAGNLKMKYGNLNQSYGYTSDVFGFAAGNPAGSHVTIEPTNGFRMINPSGDVVAQLAGGYFYVGEAADSGNRIAFDGTDMTISVENFDLSSTALRVTDSNNGLMRVGVGGSGDEVGMTGATSGGSDADSVGFWAGDSFTNRTTAPVWIKRGGDFKFGDGLLEGTSTTITGAGWTWDQYGFEGDDGDNVALLAVDVDGMVGGSANRGSYPGLSLYNRSTLTMISAGTIFGSPNRHGFALHTSYTTGEKVFEVSKDISSGDLNAQIAGAFFDATGMWGYESGYGGDTSDKSNAGVLIDWSTSSITIDNGGEITNANDDFQINENGIAFEIPDDTLQPANTLVWYSGVSVRAEIGGVRDTILGIDQLIYDSGSHLFTTDDTAKLIIQNNIDCRAPLRAVRLTRGERDNLTAQVGMIVYNTTDGKFQGYDGSSWRDMTQA